jgi:hypothetical protein
MESRPEATRKAWRATEPLPADRNAGAARQAPHRRTGPASPACGPAGASAAQ